MRQQRKGMAHVFRCGCIEGQEGEGGEMTEPHGNGKRRRLSFDKAWAEAALLVASKRLRGLTVTCPACRRKGTAFSKWVKGLREKPLYICHVNRRGCLDACELSREDAARVKKQLSIFPEDVVKLI